MHALSTFPEEISVEKYHRNNISHIYTYTQNAVCNCAWPVSKQNTSFLLRSFQCVKHFPTLWSPKRRNELPARVKPVPKLAAAEPDTRSDRIQRLTQFPFWFSKCQLNCTECAAHKKTYIINCTFSISRILTMIIYKLSSVMGNAVLSVYLCLSIALSSLLLFLNLPIFCIIRTFKQHAECCSNHCQVPQSLHISKLMEDHVEDTQTYTSSHMHTCCHTCDFFFSVRL